MIAKAGYGLAISSGIFAPALRAVDSKVKFRAKSLDGETFSTESVQGKIVLVEFWATWCPYCRRDAPAVDSLLDEFKGQGLLVLAVDVAESKKTVAAYLAKSPRDAKIVMMTDTNLAAWYGPKSFPHYAVIDRDGKTAGEQKGAGGERSLRHLLSKAGLTGDAEDGPAELEASPRRD